MTPVWFGTPGSPDVILQPTDEHEIGILGEEARLLGELTEKPFCLLAVPVENWNRDLSPWEAPPVFGNEPFGSGAEGTLGTLKALASDRTKRYYLGGYSLAGLFSLWAGYRTNLFCGVAAVSPSVWFPGFLSFMEENRFGAKRADLSLGDREEKTKNPVMATAGTCIRLARRVLEAQGVRVDLTFNPGNHFREPELRCARAFARLLNAETEHSGS